MKKNKQIKIARFFQIVLIKAFYQLRPNGVLSLIDGQNSDGDLYLKKIEKNGVRTKDGFRLLSRVSHPQNLNIVTVLIMGNIVYVSDRLSKINV